MSFSFIPYQKNTMSFVEIPKQVNMKSPMINGGKIMETSDL